jgi:hypothetical protein
MVDAMLRKATKPKDLEQSKFIEIAEQIGAGRDVEASSRARQTLKDHPFIIEIIVRGRNGVDGSRFSSGCRKGG